MIKISPHWHIVHRPLNDQEDREALLISNPYLDVFAAAEALARYVIAAPESAFLVSLYWESTADACANPGDNWAEEAKLR
jgi:hypothetical protein